MSSVLDILGQSFNSYRGGLRVSLKTNLGPEIPLYTPGTDSGPGILPALGIKYALIVRDASGAVVTTYNDPPPTDPLKQAILWAALAGAAFVLIRGLMP